MMQSVARWERLYRIRGGIPWVISLLAGDNGEDFICIESPDPNPDRVILRAWSDSNFDNIVKILAEAIEPEYREGRRLI